MLERTSELEAFEVCKNEGLGILPWSPLKGLEIHNYSAYVYVCVCVCVCVR